MMFRKLIAVALLTGGLALAGCNTVQGLGRDISSVGKATTDVAR